MKNGRLKIWLPGVLSVLLALCSVGATVAGLLHCKANMNRKQGLPDIRDCVLDFTGYGTDNRYVKQHMFGTWEFFYNQWIVSDGGAAGEPDAVVMVPHRYRQTELNGKRLTNKGYASYRMRVTGLPAGTPIYFLNNNFIGGLRGYINGELVYAYGTMVRTGENRANGEAEVTKTYTVSGDNEVLEVVFEVSSCRSGGLTAPPRLTISTLPTAPAAPLFTNNVGFIMLGLSLSLFIFSFLLHFDPAPGRRDCSFSLVRGAMFGLTLFSVGVYWRLLSFLRFNTYNLIAAAKLFFDNGLVLAVLYHFRRVGIFTRSRPVFLAGGGVSFLSLLFYLVFPGSFWGALAPMTVVAGLCLLLFPVVSYARQRPARAALYALFLYGATVFITCTAFDLWDLTISGFERSIAYLMLPLIFTVVILYRQISAENASRTIRALSAEKAYNQVRAEALAAQIRPHFIFNSLTAIQAAYEKDRALGDRALGFFSRHLRAHADSDAHETVPFSTELSYINNYIELENMRREKPVTVLLDCMDVSFSLPPLCLQPFLENAFKHAGLTERADGYVELRAFRVPGGYEVQINDNGVGFDPATVRKNAGGLKNACERLRLLAGASVTLDSRPGAGTRVKIFFPDAPEKPADPGEKEAFGAATGIKNGEKKDGASATRAEGSQDDTDSGN